MGWECEYECERTRTRAGDGVGYERWRRRRIRGGLGRYERDDDGYTADATPDGDRLGVDTEGGRTAGDDDDDEAA